MTQSKRSPAVEQFEREFPILANRIAGLLENLEAAVPPHEVPQVVLTIHRGGSNPAPKQYAPRTFLAGHRPDDYAPSCAGALNITEETT